MSTHNPQESANTPSETIYHTPSSPSNNMSVINNNQSLQDTQNTQSPSHEAEWSFYYRPNNDVQIYLIIYKEITLNELISQLLINNLYPSNDRLCSNNLFTFYFQHPNDQKIYKVVCEMISHSNIVQYLNFNILGLRQNEQQQKQPLEFSNRHKETLEFHLRQFLTDNLVSNSIGDGSNSSLNNNDNTFQQNTAVQSGDYQPQQGGSFNLGQN
ncbi:6968_t:CDS:1 [Funneliformis geosporum]|uniref:14906_t:CDS:1 n=1 Tax=Funneliformis geosporum TaxID=1117311 RepID=A0A9W4WWC4_9GLOM|nr:14906_t:CDS:1 [Funneliformis geosporum]CAI2192081.1 6968_t:CDS:1 [Funneliformis geosporum]